MAQADSENTTASGGERAPIRFVKTQLQAEDEMSRQLHFALGIVGVLRAASLEGEETLGHDDVENALVAAY